MKPEILANLRNVLAKLYPDETSIRRILADSEIDLSRIGGFTSNPVNNWHSILVEAEKIGQVDTLLSVVESEYGSNSEYRKVYTAYSLVRARQDRPLINPSKPPKIDKNVIRDFDLDSLEAEFRRTLKYEGAFAFAVRGSRELLEEYIIARILQELKRKTGRSQRYIELLLNETHIRAGEYAIEQKLIVEHQCGQLSDLFVDPVPLDTALVVWNHGIPPVNMSRLARAFWQKVDTQVLPYLHHKSRCFVVIWANVSIDKKYKYLLEDSTNLPTPQSFEVEQLKSWFRGYLGQLEINHTKIDDCLAQLEREGGHLETTFQKLRHILRDLQGGLL